MKKKARLKTITHLSSLALLSKITLTIKSPSDFFFTLDPFGMPHLVHHNKAFHTNKTNKTKQHVRIWNSTSKTDMESSIGSRHNFVRNILTEYYSHIIKNPTSEQIKEAMMKAPFVSKDNIDELSSQVSAKADELRGKTGKPTRYA